MSDEEFEWEIIEDSADSDDGVLELEDEEGAVLTEVARTDDTHRVQSDEILKRLDKLEEDFRKLVLKLKTASVTRKARVLENVRIKEEDTKKTPNITRQRNVIETPPLPIVSSTYIPTNSKKKGRYELDLSLLAVSK